MKVTEATVFKSILVIVIGFAILSLILEIKILLTIGLLIGIIALISGRAARAINWFWFKIAEVLGWINSKILISLVYYVFLFPISVFYKIRHSDVLHRKRKKAGDSYFVERNHLYAERDLENLW